MHLSTGTVRKLMIENGIWQVSKVKKKHVYQMRERRSKYGELIQIDGSPHAWFENRGPKCTLIVFIDDATGGYFIWNLKKQKLLGPMLTELKVQYIEDLLEIMWEIKLKPCNGGIIFYFPGMFYVAPVFIQNDRTNISVLITDSKGSFGCDFCYEAFICI